MADFRRFMIVLAAVALLLGTVSTASAAVGLACQTNAAAPEQVRFQGNTELMGDLVLSCTGGTAATAANVPVPAINITVSVGTEVTSRLLDDAVDGDEALLMVDEPVPGSQHVCFASDAPCLMGGQGGIATSTYLPGPAFTCPAGTDDLGNNSTCADPSENKNVFQGQWNPNQPNSVVFRGVPIDPPGTSRPALVMRVTNVRANATRFAVATGSFTPATIIMSIVVSNPNAMTINNPSQVVASVYNGLVQGQDSQVSFKQCVDVNVSGGKLKYLGGLGGPGDFATNVGFSGFVKAIEGFASAFKIRSNAGGGAIVPTSQRQPGVNYPSVETGFYNSGLADSFGPADTDFLDPRIAGAGLADFGTRIKLEFNNVPVGAHVYVPLVITNTALLKLVLIKTEAGPYSPQGASGFDSNGLLGEVALSGSPGSGVAVYEVVSEDGSNVEEADIPVIVAYIANPAGNSPSITSGPATAGISFAPTTTPPDNASEDNSVPVPRFIDNPDTQANRFSINACRTNLLYPFVTNEAGYETGLAVANTSQDPFNTITQHGTCALNFFNGSTTPPPPPVFTTPDVTAGSVYATLLTIAAGPNFQGYIIAVCNFQYAHGYAFLLGGTPGSANQVAQGYIALVIPDLLRGSQLGASPFPVAGPGSGEQLGF